MYPRQHTVDNPKLKDLLAKKTDLVLKGRQLSDDIIEIEQGNIQIDNQIKELESKVDLKEFENMAQKTTDQMKVLMEEANNIQKQIYAKLKSAIDPELGEKYGRNRELIEKLEKDRNKIGLKIQKIKDLIIPMTQKIAKPLLKDEFEDFSDVRLENGEIVIEIFSHLEDWKEARAKKLKEKYLPNKK